MCFWLSPTLRAQLPSPAPDGGYPGENTAEGDEALFSLTTGLFNTAVGFGALASNTTGGDNTAVGQGALPHNTTGDDTTAIGLTVLLGNTTGFFNTATGSSALRENLTGNANTTNGAGALGGNTTGTGNIGLGIDAGTNLTSGDSNIDIGNEGVAGEFQTIRIGSETGFHTSIGFFPGQTNTYIAGIYGVTVSNGLVVVVAADGHLGTANTVGTGFDNTVLGAGALLSNTTGDENTATGVDALQFNTTGNANTASGVQALQNNTTGNSNTATGVDALFHNTTGNNDIALGSNAGFNLTICGNNIDIGNPGLAAEGNTIRIGTQGIQTAAFIAGIFGVTLAKGVRVVVDSSGQLGTKGSSKRFKDEIKPMANASEAILALKPVSFRYKKEIDPDCTPQFGLVAEQVEKVNPDLVVRDADGKPYTVRYDAVNAMLLNEFLKEHSTVQELKKEVAALTATVKEQAAQIQKVSAQLEVSKPMQTVANNQ